MKPAQTNVKQTRTSKFPVSRYGEGKDVHEGINIKRFRGFFGINQKQLARRMNIAQQTLSDMERKKVLSLLEKESVAEGLGIDKDHLSANGEELKGFFGVEFHAKESGTNNNVHMAYIQEVHHNEITPETINSIAISFSTAMLKMLKEQQEELVKMTVEEVLKAKKENK